MTTAPAVEVHPGWLGDSAPGVSGTWAWFHLERWSDDASMVGPQPLPRWTLDASMPVGYLSILKSAVWMVAEALRRDGVSRVHLDADDMRWSRRLGLALLGDGPVTALDAASGLREATERGPHPSEEIVARIVPLFPADDQGLLRLALGPVPTAISLAAIAPSSKTTMLVRLAKRHAAARRGVDLRQALIESPTPSSEQASPLPDESLRGADAFDAMVTASHGTEAGSDGKVDPVFIEEIAHAG